MTSCESAFFHCGCICQCTAPFASVLVNAPAFAIVRVLAVLTHAFAPALAGVLAIAIVLVCMHLAFFVLSLRGYFIIPFFLGWAWVATCHNSFFCAVGGLFVLIGGVTP